MGSRPGTQTFCPNPLLEADIPSMAGSVQNFIHSPAIVCALKESVPVPRNDDESYIEKNDMN